MTLTLPDFEGRWTLRRDIADHARPGTASFSGVARFTPQAAGLRYDEEGWLTVAGQAPVTATQSYLWQAAGKGVAVSFADGRPFHRFSLADPRPGAAHWCAPDQYDVSYDFSAWPDWRATWRVKGPRKDYTMESRYSR